MTVSLFLTQYISSVIPSSVVEFGFFVIIDHVSSCTAGSWREERIRICKTVLYTKDYCKIKTRAVCMEQPCFVRREAYPGVLFIGQKKMSWIQRELICQSRLS